MALVSPTPVSDRAALDAVLSDINARLQRETAEGDVDGLRDGLLYFVEVLERQIKGDSDD
jgi:hypothetical protein